jgi:transposase
VILAEDEARVNLLPWLRSTWIVKGQRQEVMMPGKNKKHGILGAIEPATGRWLHHIAERANSATFIAFLGQILDAYPKAPVIAIVLDKISTHSSRAVERWLARHGRVKLLYGARYSPHHNPVERVWGVMKRHLAKSPALTMLGRLEEVTPSSAPGREPRCWPPRLTSTRPGYQRVTDRSCGRLLSPDWPQRRGGKSE